MTVVVRTLPSRAVRERMEYSPRRSAFAWGGDACNCILGLRWRLRSALSRWPGVTRTPSVPETATPAPHPTRVSIRSSASSVTTSIRKPAGACRTRTRVWEFPAGRRPARPGRSAAAQAAGSAGPRPACARRSRASRMGEPAFPVETPPAVQVRSAAARAAASAGRCMACAPRSRARPARSPRHVHLGCTVVAGSPPSHPANVEGSCASGGRGPALRACRRVVIEVTAKGFRSSCARRSTI